MNVTGREVVVRRDRPGDAHVRPATWTPGGGEVVVAVESAAVTSNNVTYAVLGDQLRYWHAYPAGDEQLGIVPVWGFGRVVASSAPGVDEDEQLWGFWPMATHAVLRPTRLDDHGFLDASPHRDDLAATYQRYERVSTDPLHDPDLAHLEPLYRPLFATAYLLDDLLADPDAVGAKLATVVVTSASSKTATALAHLLARRDDVEVVGVTSAGAVEHVANDGLVDRVVAYDDVDTLTARGPTALVDVAGRAAVTAAIHDALGEALVASIVVGMTHHDAAGADAPPTGPTPTMFFAPSRAAARAKDWGPAGLARRIAEAWRPFATWVDDRVVVREVPGLDALVPEWQALVAGQIDPGEGLLVVP